MIMKKSLLLIFFAVLALADSMSTRHRRAKLTEAGAATQPPQNNTKQTPYCARDTPCAWSIYKLNIKIIEHNLTNDYCICAAGLICTYTNDDPESSTYVYKCRQPHEVIEIET